MTGSSDLRVCVLGCGPAGLLAAYAAEQEGAHVEIYSTKQKSTIHGAQFLHTEIPGFENIPKRDVTIQHYGTEEGYAKKVYGPLASAIKTSWGKYDGAIEAWSMVHLYDKLWKMYRNKITNVDINREVINGLEWTEFDLRLSTVPAPLLCLNPDEHYFDAQRFWVYGLPQDKMSHLGGNVIAYNGEQGNPWFRTSRLFGSSYLEYGEHSVRPDGCQPAKKIVGSNCNCRPAWRRMGRFGKWQRGVLVHDAYWETKNAVLAMFGSGTSRRSN